MTSTHKKYNNIIDALYKDFEFNRFDYLRNDCTNNPKTDSSQTISQMKNTIEKIHDKCYYFYDINSTNEWFNSNNIYLKYLICHTYKKIGWLLRHKFIIDKSFYDGDRHVLRRF